MEVRLSNLLINNDEFRIDSEFFKKEFTVLNNLLIDSPKLNDLVYMSDLSTNGSFKTVSDIVNDNNPKVIPFIRSGNTGNIFIQKDDLIFISKEAHNKLPKSTTKLHDIIMARKGKIGGATIIMSDEVGFNCNENVIKLDIKDKDILNPFYFATFFNSKFGFQQIERLSTGNVQPWVSIYQIRKLVIPILSNSFQLKIEKLVLLAHKKLQESKFLYEKAKNLLLKELDLLDFKPTTQNISIKSFSESFGSSGRLDSEYYLPKYDEIEKSIINYNNKETKILDEFELIKTKFDKSKNGYNYIEIGNVNISDGSNISNYILLKQLPANAKIKVKKGDLLISTVRPNRGAVTIINSNDNDLIVSGAFTVLRKKENSKINTQVLQVLLRTDIYKELLLKYNSGTSYPVIKDNDILNLKIPIIDKQIQTQIENKIKESFRLKEESKEILELAKRGVEVAIEDGEELALEFIKEKR